MTRPSPAQDDFRLFVDLGSPAIEPGGTTAALVVSRTVWSKDTRENDLVAVNLATRAQRTLVANREGLGSPAYSPDGSLLAFLASSGKGKDARNEIFVMPANGGTARQVTQSATGIDDFAWRPDGEGFAFAASDPNPKKIGAERFRDSFVFTTEPITAFSAPKPDHLFVVPLKGGSARQLTYGASSDADISWAPDGKSITFTRYADAILNDQDASHVAIVDLGSKRVRALTGRTMRESEPMYSPDGKNIAYFYTGGDSQVALTQIFVTTLQGGAGREITGSIDRSIGTAAWTSDSRSLIVSAPDGLTNALYRVSLDRHVDRIDPGDVTPGIPLSTTGGAEQPDLLGAIARNGTVAFVGTSTAQPPELFALTPGKPAMRVSDFNAALERFRWLPAHEVTFPTTTGVTGNGLLYLPPGYNPHRTFPTVVYIHGGPGDPTLRTFDYWAQLMAARGWLVLRPNYRGSPNLGYLYQHSILYDPEDGPGKDIVAALNAVRARGIVDSSRIGVSGWSYGGIMTSWLISKYHFWRAAVSGASVNDWITDYGTADDSGEDVALMHGSPFVGDNAEAWRRISAISYAADVTTPVLILSDVGDNRDPFATSSMYWRALRDNGKDATLRVWPIAGHFPDDPVRIADIYRYWIDYIGRHFK